MAGPGIGQDLSGDQIAALNAANNPSETNPVATMSDITGTANYVHTQLVPATTWIVNHNLGRKVSAQVVDLSGVNITTEITWNTDNQITITANQPITGYAYCN